MPQNEPTRNYDRLKASVLKMIDANSISNDCQKKRQKELTKALVV